MPKIKSNTPVLLSKDNDSVAVHGRKSYKRSKSGGYRNTFINGNFILKVDSNPHDNSECLREYNFYTKTLKKSDKKYFAKLVAFGTVIDGMNYTIQKYYTAYRKRLPNETLRKYALTVEKLIKKYKLWDVDSNCFNYDGKLQTNFDEFECCRERHGYESHNWMITEDMKLIIFDYAQYGKYR